MACPLIEQCKIKIEQCSIIRYGLAAQHKLGDFGLARRADSEAV
jgi:hypothetical protein